MHTFPSGSLEATNVTLKQMIEAAYNFKPYLVCGGPAWMDSDRFDITAKADEAAAQDKSRVIALGRDAPLRMMLMLQTLLEDRFNVKVHR
jgi:bla regulator protein BlaR1